MLDSSLDPRMLLTSLAEAFAHGDAPRGETLLADALDAGIPWDEVTVAAARGVSERYARQQAGSVA